MVLQDCELFNKAGKVVSEFGLKFCYHNHDHEFKNVFDGTRAIDLLFANTDPKCVHFEIDVAWVTYGGEDPVAFLNAHKGRIPVIHLKDIADLSQRAKFTAVGTGAVKVKGSVEAAVANGARWVVVEQDAPNNLTGMESVQASFLNIKELGLLKDRG
jgi:sugar phosphate isomerase/epimerase